MKKRHLIPLIVVSLAVIFPSCSKWVEDVDPVFDAVEDQRLNDASQAEFLLRGVKGDLYRIWDREDPMTEMHSDAFYWDIRWSNDFHAQNIDLVQGAFTIENYEDPFRDVATLIKDSDDMLTRLSLMLETGTVATQLQDEMRWWANFLGGYGRLLMGTYFGLSADGTKPGGVISPDPDTGAEFGEFKTTNQLAAMAIAKFTEALKYSPPGGGKDGIADADYADRVVWSFMARTHIFNHTGGMGGAANLVNAAAAASAAAKGLQDGDDPFVVEFGEGFTNPYWDIMGRNDPRNMIDPRYVKYVLADPKEGEIINGFKLDDMTAHPGIERYWTAAVLDMDTSNPRFPVFSTSGGASLAENPAVQVGGTWTNLEGESGARGRYNSDTPRANVKNPKERLPIYELPLGTSFMDEYFANGQYKYDVFFLLPFDYVQDRYNQRTQDFALIEWQEMELIQAEVDIRNGDNASALDHINTVRASHNLDPKTMDDMLNYSNPWGGAYDITGPLGLLIEERDKEMLMKGNRLYDQYRFGIWHLAPPPAEWVYYPVSQGEVDANPNLSDSDR